MQSDYPDDPPGMMQDLEQADARSLDRAIAEGRIALHYQPKLNARSGKLDSAEALLRWRNRSGELLPADRMVASAERHGTIAALTDWVLDRTIADQRELAAAGFDIPFYINMPAALISSADYMARILAQLAPAKGAIGLEITETGMITDPEGSLASLNLLSEAGVRLAIDDYGSGFSSLAYLQRMPVDELKMDRIFISRLTTSARDPLLVRSTIDLAHALEMTVTAEGVEDAATLALLQVMGCDLVQGFFLSRPMPFDQLEGFARNRRGPLEVSPLEKLKRRLAGRPVVDPIEP